MRGVAYSRCRNLYAPVRNSIWQCAQMLVADTNIHQRVHAKISWQI